MHIYMGKLQCNQFCVSCTYYMLINTNLAINTIFFFSFYIILVLFTIFPYILYAVE